MAVTLPCVLLLLDYWPLRRWKTETSSTGKPFAAVVREKLPFFALAGAASAVTVWAQKTGGAVTTLARFSPAERLGNAVVSYDRYLEKLFCPVDLAAYYPHPGKWPAWRITLACAVLAGISWGVWRFARRLPFAVTGWLWFLGTLVPVIGFVQVGSQSMADRYTYLPAIGIFIMVAWGVPEVLSSWPKRNALLAGIATAYFFVCLALTSAQLKVWRNDQTLFEHALRVTENNFIAHGHVAGALLAQGKAREGVAHYSEAVKINPAYVQGQNNLGAELAKEGLLDEAADHFAEVIRIRPSDPDGPFNLGVVRFQQRQYEAAIAALTEAVKISPNYVLAHNALGYALGGAGRQAEAIAEFATVLRLDPTAARHAQLADALGVGGRWDEAVSQYSEALRLEPAMSEVRLNLARLLALAGRHAEAIPNFEVYVRANQTNAVARYAFAESLKRLGRLQEANLQLAEALKLDPKTRMDPKIFSAPEK
jgi:tetratricopeptide (TPR) repeat protein